MLLLLLLSHFSRVWLCATPQTAAHQASRPWDSPGKNTGVGCHFLLQCIKVKSESEVTQSYPTLATPWTAAFQAPLSMGFSRKEYWRGCHCLLWRRNEAGVNLYNVSSDRQYEGKWNRVLGEWVIRQLLFSTGIRKGLSVRDIWTVAKWSDR